jgi:lysozyme
LEKINAQMKMTRVVAGSFGLAALAGGVLLYLNTGSVTGKENRSGSKVSPSYPSFGITLPGEYNLHGIDVSRHQREIDWEAVSQMTHKDIGISFAFIKASEGRTVTDDYFKRNWEQAKEHGLLRGAYHFYRPHLTAAEQASLFFRMVPKLEKGDLAPVLDIEMRGSCPPARLKRNLKQWLVMVERHYGVTPILYTNWGFYKAYLSGKDFKKYPLWIAHYKTPDLNYKLSNWEFWQHSDRGRCNGIAGTVDFNVFNGDVQDMQKLCKQ